MDWKLNMVSTGFSSHRIKKGFVIFTISFIGSALASDQSMLFGSWGSEAQCARSLITPTGTKRAAPFEIKQDWLLQGDIWCRLSWVTTVLEDDGGYAIASALCGEDAVRDYRIDFTLADNQLIVLWDQQIANGPLQRC